MVSPALYLFFVVNYDFSYFFPLKVNPLKEHSHRSPEFPNQIFRKSVQGFLSYDRTNKQNRDYNFMYRIPNEYFMLAIVC